MVNAIVRVRVAGAVALTLALATTLVTPSRLAQLPGGLRTPVLAIELARSRSEVEAMLGPASAQREAWRAGLRHGTLLDFALLLAYGALLSFAARALDAGGSRRPELRAAFVLAPIAAAADALENLCLLEILSTGEDEYTRTLTLLAFATWTKWLALGLCCACLAPALFARGKLATAAGLAGVAALLCVGPAFLWRGLYAEAMLGAIALCQVGVWSWSLRADAGSSGGVALEAETF